MKKLKIKIITGFRQDQGYTIDANEAHKAYYLFLNPEQRGIFSNGLALIGKDIKHIEPDYNATMGWNPTYQLGDEDWNEIRSEGVDKDMRELMQQATKYATPEMINKPLNDIKKLDQHGS